MRDATVMLGSLHRFMELQSSPPRRDATLLLLLPAYDHHASIHTSLAGCDPCCDISVCDFKVFQSTHPSRDVTSMAYNSLNASAVSIHTSLAGCDPFLARSASMLLCFNPHIPRGMWLRWRDRVLQGAARFNPHIPRGMWRQFFTKNKSLETRILYTNHNNSWFWYSVLIHFSVKPCRKWVRNPLL